MVSSASTRRKSNQEERKKKMELLDRTIAIFGMEHPATIKVAQLLERGEYNLAIDAFSQAMAQKEIDEMDEEED